MLFWRFRVLAFYFVVSIFTVLFVSTIFFPLKFFNVRYNIKYAAAVIFSYIFIWLAWLICGLKYKAEGVDKLPKYPCIVMSNHQSFWDNIFMQLIIPRHSWIIKKELFKIPFWGWGLKILEPVAVDRTNNYSVKQILENGIKKINNGLWLIVFPEATRLRPEQSTKFRPSAAKLAIDAKVPIVLMAHNAGVYWPKGFWIKKPGIVTVKIIEVLTTDFISNYDTRELTKYIEEVINKEKQILLELVAESPAEVQLKTIKF